MKSLFHAISLAMVALFGGGQLSAQGTLLFSNVRTDAPISRAGIGLGPGYLVELALLLPSDGLGVKGIRLSKEAPFLCCGLFGGGIVSVPGVPAGEEVEVVLVVSQPNPLDVDEGFFGPAWGVSNPVSVVLGGLGDPPSEPGTLLGLAPFDVGYSWDGLGCCYGPFDDFFAELGSCENLLEVDEYSWSWGQPGLEYRIVDGNMIELKWRAGSPLVLYSAPVLDRADSKRVIGDHYANGFRVLRVSATEPQRYYWLAQPADD